MKHRSQILVLGLALVPTLAASAQLTLEEALQESLTKGPNGQYLQIAIDSAHSVVEEVRAVAFPKIQGYANAGAARQPNMFSGLFKGQPGAPGPDDPTWSVSYGVQLDQPLFTFGKVTTALRMARTQTRITKTQFRAQRQTSQKEVLDSWIGAVLTQQRVGTLERSQVRQRELVAFLERNFKAGSGIRAQVLLARSQMLALQPQVQAAQRDASGARKALNRLLGRPASDTATLDTLGLPALEALAVPTRDEALANALEKRQDLQTLNEVKSLQSDLASVYRANYYPNVALHGKLGVLSLNTNSGTDAVTGAGDLRNNYEWQLGVGVQWNIFDGFEQSSKASATRANLRQLELKNADLKRFVEIQVESALSDRLGADSAYAAAQEGLAAAQEARDLYVNNFHAGSGALSEVLQSEEGLRLAELGLVSARLQRTRAAAELALAQGQDLIPLSEAP